MILRPRLWLPVASLLYAARDLIFREAPDHVSGVSTDPVTPEAPEWPSATELWASGMHSTDWEWREVTSATMLHSCHLPIGRHRVES